MFLRGRYGHGGRVGYDREWRADPARSGGGELIDQGVHLIDLSRWFLGDFSTVDGFAATYFWDMPVDDNGFVPAANGDRPGRVAARELHRVEEPVLVRDLRPRRQDRDRRPRRQLRRRAAGVLPDAARNGTARDHDLGVPARRPILGDRVGGVHRRHPAGPDAVGRPGRGPRRAVASSKRSTRRSGYTASRGRPPA